MDRPPHSTEPTSPPGCGDDWVPQTGRVELRPDEVHVWRVDVGARTPTGVAALAALSDGERARAARFHFEADRRRFAASHVALRGTLASYLGVEPSSLLFGDGPHGKPYLDAPDAGRSVRFSLSHSGDMALVAVSLDREVGVDVERVRPREDLDGFAARYFSPHEREAFARIPSDDRLRVFFETWTLKEAYLKACGDGLLRELDTFDVTVGDAAPRLLAVRDRSGDEARWALRRLDPGEGFAAALVVEGACLPTRRWGWSGWAKGAPEC